MPAKSHITLHNVALNVQSVYHPDLMSGEGREGMLGPLLSQSNVPLK